MATMAGFASRIRSHASRVPIVADRMVRTAALVADRELVLATPVDTGRARSNWLVSLDGPQDGVIDAYVEGKDGSTAAANTQAAIDDGAAYINARRFGQDIHITNNLPYIGRLNEGWSAQAPAGFVQAAIKRAIAAVRQMKVF